MYLSIRKLLQHNTVAFVCMLASVKIKKQFMQITTTNRTLNQFSTEQLCATEPDKPSQYPHAYLLRVPTVQRRDVLPMHNALKRCPCVSGADERRF